METFTFPKTMVENPQFQLQKQRNFNFLENAAIDAPIIEHIKSFNQLPYCFTLQCCHGHFLYNGQQDSQNNDPLPISDSISKVEYRIAYIAFCVDFNDQGREFLDSLKKITSIDNEYIQFGCAEWFWERQVNSYAIQVEPNRYKFQDMAIIDYNEALKIQTVRNIFFDQLMEIILTQIGKI